MIIFISEDEAYRNWLEDHPRGFVVSAHRRPTARYLMLHKASCPSISSSQQKGWTSGPYIKLCARKAAELDAWAEAEFGGHLRRCTHCRPPGKRSGQRIPDAHDESGEPHHLTRLGEHLLSFVLEVAVMSLDGIAGYQDEPPTVGGLAESEGKTVRQIAPAIARLLEDEFITVDGESSPEVALRGRRIVYPTPQALRTVPAFAEMSDRELRRAIAGLHGDVE